MIEAFSCDSYFYIVTAYASYGDLTSFFEQYPNVRTVEANLREIFRQTALGVAELHSQNIYHRDIKLMNVFVQTTGKDGFKILLGDLGHSCILNPG